VRQLEYEYRGDLYPDRRGEYVTVVGRSVETLDGKPVPYPTIVRFKADGFLGIADEVGQLFLPIAPESHRG